MPRPSADHDFSDQDGGAEHQASDHEYQDECESAPGASEIREAPDTAEADGGADRAERKCQIRRPALTAHLDRSM